MKDRRSSFAFLSSVFGRVLAGGILLATAGCASTKIVYLDRPLADRIPAGLLKCAPRPPLGDIAHQTGVGRFVIAVDEAGEDCRSKNRAIGRIVREEKT